MRSLFRNTKYVLAFLVLAFLSAVYSAFATPPVSRYIPGETLDPTCAPGDAECSVIPVNIGDEVGSGNATSVLFIDDTGLLGEDNTNFLYDATSRYLYSDNLALANNLEITTTTSSTVGVITKDSVRFIHTYKPAGTNDNLFIGKTSGNFTLAATSNLNGNVGIGQNVLTNLSSGYFNTILGAYAGNSVTTGYSNVFIGTQASRNNATGLRNVAIGDAALYGSGHSNHSSTDNVSIGQSSMYFTSTSARNISIGTEAGYNNSSASDNVFIGYQSGHDITTESGNVFIGYLSGSDATGSNKLYIENSASESPLIYGDFASNYIRINGDLGVGVVPDQSLDIDGNFEFPATASSSVGVIMQNGGRFIHTYGTQNLFLGLNAGNFTTSGGGGNIGFGASTLASLTIGTENIIVGAGAATSLTSGSGNVAMGVGTLQGFGTGSDNVAIGYLAGQNLSSGSNNVFIGSRIGTTDDFTMSNSVIIGNNYVPTDDTFDANTNILVIDGEISSTPLVYGDFTLNTFSINGDFGVGDATPDYLVDIEDSGVDTDIFALTDADGSCLHDPEAGAETVTCSSDERLKQNITDAGDILPYFRGFNIREYDVLASGDHMFGVIAQEVDEIYPELVKVGANGYYTVEIPSSWEMIKAIQELDVAVSDIRNLDTNNQDTFASALVAWFADKANGIGKLFANEVHTNMLCVGDTCVSEEEFLQMLGNSNIPTDNNSDDNGSEEGDSLPEEEEPIEDAQDDQPIQPDDQVEEGNPPADQNGETDNEAPQVEDSGSSEPAPSEV